MADSNSERDEDREDVKNLVLILIGIFLSFGVQAFSEGLKAAFYPQLYPRWRFSEQLHRNTGYPTVGFNGNCGDSGAAIAKSEEQTKAAKIADGF